MQIQKKGAVLEDFGAAPLGGWMDRSAINTIPFDFIALGFFLCSAINGILAVQKTVLCGLKFSLYPEVLFHL